MSSELRLFRGWAVVFGLAASLSGYPASGADSVPVWVGSWAASQQIPEPNNLAPAAQLGHATVRQIVHLSRGGTRIRVRVSNAFGTAPLHLLAVHVAHPLSTAVPRIDPASDRAVTFDARADVLIPAGAEYTSDALDYPVAPLSDLAISMQLESAPEQQTGHPGAHAVSYLATGAPVSAADLPAAQRLEHWYFLSGVEVSVPGGAAVVVAFGDSITDGHGSTTNGNDRWPDDLAARLQGNAATRGMAVLNEGIGGNHLLTDGLGPNALSRLDRDVLAQTAVRYLIVLEGINDIGMLARGATGTEAQHEQLVGRMIGAYRQIVLRAHAHGIKVIGATVLPFMDSDYYHPTQANEHDRQVVNAWIRAPGHFDAVVDFDQLTADPAHPDHMRADYDSGDHLHPSPAGYRAMADAIPLGLFAQSAHK